jgi:hypothetical protein
MIILFWGSLDLLCQVDITPPISPELNFVTVNNLSGRIELNWTPSPSVDVSGYVVYEFNDGEGFAIDTIKDPTATSYDQISNIGAGYFSQSFVVAAIDSSDNISPLSNDLRTIYVSSITDTCNKKIGITWNEYLSFPRSVTGYQLFSKINDGEWGLAGETDNNTTEYIIDDFETDSQYCFKVVANLVGDYQSESNISCVNTAMSRPPSWINADYATTGIDNKISLSFTIDPLSEIKTFSLLRKETTETEFISIASLVSNDNHIVYEDLNANPLKKYIYKIAAVNNCGNAIVYSNVASNIVLTVDRIDDNTIDLQWNNYRDWHGEIIRQSLMANVGSGFYEDKTIDPGDTVLTVYYTDYMELASASEVVFMIKMEESGNPYGINGESLSQPVAVKATEKITVPNLFTPDGNGQNDNFRPILSFIPKDYQLTITNLNRNIIFESRDYLEEWNGRSSGTIVPEGVYLWQLRITSATGENITKTGTVTVVFNL